MYGGMIRSYQRVLTKCMIPAKTKNGPKSLPIGRILWIEDRVGLGDREALLVQSPAYDHAPQILESQLGRGREIVGGADPPRVDRLAVGCLGGLAERIEVRALHQAVRVRGRVDEPPHPAIAEGCDHLGRAELR